MADMSPASFERLHAQFVRPNNTLWHNYHGRAGGIYCTFWDASRAPFPALYPCTGWPDGAHNPDPRWPAGPVPMKDAWIAKLNATNLLKTDDASASASAAAAPADRRVRPDGLAPPTMDDLWDNTAHFNLLRSVPLNAQNFQHVDAGTRVVVINATWYLFGRWDLGATKKCPNGEISINVRASTDSGRSWDEPHSIAEPDAVKTCIYADGSAFYDHETSTWHYLVQVLDVGGTGGWMGAHFSLRGQSPFGKWVADAQNPVITSGSLFKKICAGGIAGGKHCDIGMIDEGTFQIVEKVAGDFYVTFHGYDYQRKAAARGVARTADFVRWEVTGGASNLPGDVIFAAADCSDWNVPWGQGGCIGSGEASILRTSSGYMYQVIEATDLELGCDLKRGEQRSSAGKNTGNFDGISGNAQSDRDVVF